MQKLANISAFESLMNGSVPSYNSVFNKEYPKSTSHPFRDGFKSGWDWWPWVIPYNPLAIPASLLLSLLFKTGSGTINGIKKKLGHPFHTRKVAKKIEDLIQGLMAEGIPHEGYKAFYELMDDFYEKKRMNRDQYVQLLKDLFWGNKIYRSTDYDDPKFEGEEPFEYEGKSLASLAKAPLSLLLGKREDVDGDDVGDTDDDTAPPHLLRGGKTVRIH